MNYYSRLSSKGVAIFLFHGVINQNEYGIRNYNRKHIEEKYFREVLKELKKNGTPLSMDDIKNINQSGEKYPPKSFVITFDDGFENNYTIAAPILNDLHIPATFYITTGFIQNNLMSWIDQIEFCFEHSVSGKLQLPWRKELSEFSDFQTKKKILEDIRYNVKNNLEIDIQSLVKAIFKQLNISYVEQSSDPLDQKMSWDQVAKIDSDNSFIIGGHTRTHQIMSFLSDFELEQEISNSLDALDAVCKSRTVHYSYPEGLEHCYSEKVILKLKEAKIECCPTAIDGINTGKEGLFKLHRILVL